MAFGVSLFQVQAERSDILLGCGKTYMAKHLLNGHDICPVFHQLRCKGVSESVGGDFFLYLCFLCIGTNWLFCFTSIKISSRKIGCKFCNGFHEVNAIKELDELDNIATFPAAEALPEVFVRGNGKGMGFCCLRGKSNILCILCRSF